MLSRFSERSRFYSCKLKVGKPRQQLRLDTCLAVEFVMSRRIRFGRLCLANVICLTAILPKWAALSHIVKGQSRSPRCKLYAEIGFLFVSVLAKSGVVGAPARRLRRWIHAHQNCVKAIITRVTNPRRYFRPDGERAHRAVLRCPIAIRRERQAKSFGQIGGLRWNCVN